MQITFRKIDEMEVVELTRPDGTVVALPATHRSADTGIRYCDLPEYGAFKRSQEAHEPAAEAEQPVSRKSRRRK